MVGGYAKVGEDGLKLYRRALELLLAAPRLEHKDLIDQLIQHFEGKHALYVQGRRRQARDRIYHNARRRVERRLERGFDLAARTADVRG